MSIQDIATHVKNNGWVEFGSKANADEFAKSDIAKGLERYSNTGFAVKGYNPYAAPKANAKQSRAPAKPTPEPAQSAQPQPSQSISMLGEAVPPLPKEEQAHHQGAPLNRQEVGRLNSLMQNMPQNDQERIQTLFSVKDYDGIRKMIRDNTADEKINRNDIESAKNIAEILMSYPKAMQSAKGGARFSLSQLKNILVNGRLADINRMNNALASRLRENGENPHRVMNLPARWEEPAVEGEVQEAERNKQPYNANQLEAPAIESEHLSSDEFLQTLNHTERGFMEYLDDVFDNVKLGFNDVMQYLNDKRNKIFDKRMEYVISKGVEGLPGAFYTDGGKMVLNEVPSQEVQSAWTTLLGMRKNFGASLANAPEEYKNEYLRVEKIVKDYLRPTITEQCKKNESYRRLSYAITGLEQIADKANEYERRVSEEGRRSGAKSYRDVSAEKRQALEGSATAWAGVLQNDVKPSSKPKQNAKPVNKPAQQEENAPAYGSDVAENVARMANGGNREAWIDNAAEQKANESTEAIKIDEMSTTPNDDVAQNIADGQKAIADVMKNHKEVVNAMYRPEVGGIDFVYGEVGTDAKKHKDGYGIAKIQYKHGDKAVQMIPEVIAKGKYEPSNYNDRAYFLHNGYRAVVRFTWDGNKKTWLVTNFLDKKIKNPDSADDFVRSAPTTDDTISSSEQSSLTSTIPQNQQNVKEKKSIIERKTQAKQQDSNSMRKELIEQAAANEDTWVNSKKSELHLEDDNDTVVKLTPQELKYYHDLIKKVW